ncbi:MAG: aconitase X catalytic domain-containing protein [Pseudolabrys sp.]|nr:aconitase X catalytic domain-containing protein [Pseudolabrys sp.]
MNLTAHQQEMLDGTQGWPRQLATRMLVAVGRAHAADRLIPVHSVHLGLSGASMGEAGMRLFETLAARGGRFVVPTTLNILSMDRRTAGASAQLRDLESVQTRIADACLAMGAAPSFTCNPFLLGVTPQRDTSVAWNESATAPYVNGMLGARTNREGATALASALTGLTAHYGMHIPRNRFGTRLIVVDTPVRGPDMFNLLGGAVARAAEAHIPVIEGLDRTPTLDEMTAFCAAFAAISPLPMLHIVGVTAEAPTRADAMLPGHVADVVRIDAATLTQEARRYDTADDTALDVVAIGCPHASVAQVREISDLLGDRVIADTVRFWIQVNRACAEEAEGSGLAARLERRNVRLLSDSCVHVAYDEIPAGRTLATNSLKIAYLTASHHVRVRLGSLAQCIDSAVAGRWRG